MEAESQPVKALQVRKEREESRLKLFQEFKGKFAGVTKALADVSDFRKFRELKVDLGDGASQVSVTVDKEKAQLAPTIFRSMNSPLVLRSFRTVSKIRTMPHLASALL